MYDRLARADFTRARRKAFWQKLQNWFSGRPDSLLPYDQVREALPIQGQRYRGLQAIPLNMIVGSMGRYHEFNRAFLPTQSHTLGRWVNIGRAHYQDVSLPPIEVYKLGEVYFVKDGNHRVSVGKELGMEFIDAYVTEIDIPVNLTTDTDTADLAIKRETALFLDKTRLLNLFPDAEIELSLVGEVDRLFEHVDTHRYYLGLESSTEPSYEDAVRSWYTEVFAPLVAEIEKQGLRRHFENLTKTDLYLLVSEYQWMLRKVYTDEASLEEANRLFTETLSKISPAAEQPARRITRTLKNAPWLDAFILGQERVEFVNKTGLELDTTVPGAYTQLIEHVYDHRWYMGIDQNREVPISEAVQDWHENVYRPLVVLIEEMDILRYFPERTETDLFLWIIEHQRELSEALDWEIPSKLAAQSLLERAESGTEDLPPTDETWAPKKQPSALLFTNLLVPIGDRPEDMAALEQALIIAKRNVGRIHGLHVISSQDENDETAHQVIVDDFEGRCRSAGIPGKIALAPGSIARVIAERAAWMDLIILNLSYPPASGTLSKMSSGIRYVLRRSGRPVLIVPNNVTPLRKILLAYDGSPLADEVLFYAAFFLTFWEDTELTVLSAGDNKKPTRKMLDQARGFLDTHNVSATYIRKIGPAPAAILETAAETLSDLILLGGYGYAPLMEFAFGSTLDDVLRQTQVPVLIRT